MNNRYNWNDGRKGKNKEIIAHSKTEITCSPIDNNNEEEKTEAMSHQHVEFLLHPLPFSVLF